MSKQNHIEHKFHGLVRHKLYRIWAGMKTRCNNENDTNYRRYGRRGITVCREWTFDFKVFYDWAIANGWQKDLLLDRIDNNGNYEPTNCRFVTYQTSNTNQNIRINNTSGYIGVGKSKQICRTKPWYARIRENYKRKYIGLFKTPIEAAIARDRYIKNNNLPHTLNFK